MPEVTDTEAHKSQPEKDRKKRNLIITIFALVLAIILTIGIIEYRNSRVPKREEIILAINKNDNQKAIAGLKKLIKASKSKPEIALYDRMLGDVYQNNNQIDLAIAAYKQAVATNGMTSKLAVHLGYAYESKGDKAQAIRYFEQAIKLWPKTDPLYNAETQSYQQKVDELRGTK